MTPKPRSAAPRSVAETLLAAQLSQAGIYYDREVLFAQALGRKWRCDFLVQPGDILIEVEGGLYVAGRHTQGKGYEADLEKYNAAVELGYRVLRYSPRHINDGSALEQIRRILSLEEEPNRDAA